MMILRPYQCEAIEAVYRHLHERDDNPCIVIPTAGGKTPVMATICRDAVQRWGGRVLILAHVRELLEQTAGNLQLVAPNLPVGIYSAGMRRRELGNPVTVASIQSVYKKACDMGAVNPIMVDEAHLIPPDGEGRYREFLTDMKKINPQVRVIGLTATPFRLKSGVICSPENILNKVCFEVSVRELIEQGFLCTLRTKGGSISPAYDQLHVRGGEYIAGEVEDLMDVGDLVDSACREIVEETRDRRSVLIFASGVRHGEHICRVMTQRHQVECGFVCGDTLPFNRNVLLKRFRAGSLKYLCNVNVLTTGFDAPSIDCVVLLRPTLSTGLYYQMVGRGFRLHPTKTDCLVLDFGGNVVRHGPVDQLRVAIDDRFGNGKSPVKKCPQCRALIAAGFAACPDCGYAFPTRQNRKHEATASSDGILSGQSTRTEYEVVDVYCAVHTKRGAPPEAPRTMRVDYRIGFNDHVSEWVCFEHTGFAQHRAAQWWSRRSHEPVPSSTEEAVDLADTGALAPTLGVTVEHEAGERFDRVVAYRLGEKPPWVGSEDLEEVSVAEAEEVPF